MGGYYLPFGPDIKLGQPFGARPGLYPNPPGGHNGDDWLTWVGVPVRAAGDGEVLFAGTFDDTYADNFGWNLNYGGNMVILNMDGPYGPYFEYGHLSDIYVKSGQRVKAGDIIALSGESDGGTGVISGPHCHVGCLPWNFNLNSDTYGRVNPRIYMTEYWVDEPIVIQPESVIEIPKEWDEMATREDVKGAIREVLAEPAILDALALAVLKRDCFLVDPSGKTENVTGTTNLAKKINWAAHNDAQQLEAIVQIGSQLGLKLDHLLEVHAEPQVVAPGDAPDDTTAGAPTPSADAPAQ